METQLNSTVKSLSFLICDQGLRLEFWGFSRLIRLALDNGLKTVEFSLNQTAGFLIDTSFSSVAMCKTDKDCSVSMCDMVSSIC